MAPTAKLSLLLILAMAMLSARADHHKETNMVVYFQDYVGVPNATGIPFADIPGKLWTFISFGTVYCTDDPLTEGIDRDSAPVGRGQGLYVTSALDGSSLLVLVSILFTNKKYKGSTLQIQGTSRIFEKYREVSVVSGTGKFRFARGYATFETVLVDSANGYSVIQCNITVRSG